VHPFLFAMKKPLIAGLAFACSLGAALGGSSVPSHAGRIPGGRMSQAHAAIPVPPPLPAWRTRAHRAAQPVQVGIASWYGGPEFHITADGETFRDNRMAAASRTLPFNTRVRVTNLRNGRSVVVRINDRGPYVLGRVIDLTPEAAKKLHMKRRGLAPVTIEVVSNDLPSSLANDTDADQ
jgi:rare lipoprotein A